MKHLVVSFLKDESGSTAIEYSLIAALVSVAITGAVMTLSEKVKDIYQTVAEAVPTDPAPPAP